MIHCFFKDHVTIVTRKHRRIVRFSNGNAMMRGFDGLLISSIHNNVTRVDFFITYLLLFFLYSFKICMIKKRKCRDVSRFQRTCYYL